ncbi:family 10 glycosylhydrolase [Planctomycetota bacterium]
MSIRINIKDRFVELGSSFSIEADISELIHISRGSRKRIMETIEVEFPGFTVSEQEVSKSNLSLRLYGSISQPGFYPLKVTIQTAHEIFTARDYVVVLPEKGKEKDTGVFDSIGYYVFLGQKGIVDERGRGLGSWTGDQWKELIQWMSDNGMDCIWFSVNGPWLGYPSKKYPQLTDETSVNVQENFLGNIISFAHERGVRVYLSYVCDDYAEGFGSLHPETLNLDREGNAYAVPNVRKNLYNPTGCCLEIPIVRQYILDVVEETVSMYKEADGIIIHPNEEAIDRFNPETQKKFSEETGKDLFEVSDEERRGWYAEKAGELVRDMQAQAQAVNPDMECISFQVHWLDDYPKVFKQVLPESVTMCVWQYLHHGTALENRKLFKWQEQFPPERLIYMPNGFDYRYPKDPDAQWLRHVGNDQLLSTAHSLGYPSCVYYVHHLLGPEEERMRDLIMAKYPLSSRVQNRNEKFLRKIHEDYFRTQSTKGGSKERNQ